MNDQAKLFKGMLEERGTYLFYHQPQIKFETNERNVQGWFVATYENIRQVQSLSTL